MSEEPEQREPGSPVSESLAAAARRSGLGRVAPGATPSGRDLLGAMGGVRGLAESVLPGLLFLVVYTVTGLLLPSVAAPVVLSVVFLVVRIATHGPVMSSIVGLVLTGVSAVLALVTGRPENNFVPGFWINGAALVLLLVTILARRPLVGLVVGLLSDDARWREDPAKRRVAYASTWLWVGLFVVRLAVELPLYFASWTTALATARLVTGVPLYAAMLWITWLLVRAAHARAARD